MAVGWELVVLHTTPSMFGKLPVHALGGVDTWTRNFQCRFIEGQTHFGIPGGAKLEYLGCSYLNSDTTSERAPSQVETND